MSYASEIHELIISNLIRILGNAFLDTSCRVYPSNRMVYVADCKRCYYPDAMIVCGKSEFHAYKGKMKATTNPRVIIEVLSESTAAVDRNEKWRCYKKISSLQEYILIEQNEAYIELYRKADDHSGWFITDFEGLGSTITINDKSFKMSEVYRNVEAEW
jgi:Uma2 family endonuclease